MGGQLMKNHYIAVDGTIYSWETVDSPQPPLDAFGVLVALLAAQQVIGIEDAANVIGLTAQQLTAEVQAWAVAQQNAG